MATEIFTPPPRSPLAAELEEKLAAYGKVGLLIDDSPDAARDLASEMYATLTLPSWWIPVKSIEAALTCLDRLSGQVAKAPPIFVIADRRLPIRDEGSPIDWWKNRSVDGSKEATLWKKLQELGEPSSSGPRSVIYVTSYPVMAAEAKEHWKSRASNPLFRHAWWTDEEENASVSGPLLRFGPEPEGSLSRVTKLRKKGAEEAPCWDAFLQTLVKGVAELGGTYKSPERSPEAKEARWFEVLGDMTAAGRRSQGMNFGRPLYAALPPSKRAEEKNSATDKLDIPKLPTSDTPLNLLLGAEFSRPDPRHKNGRHTWYLLSASIEAFLHDLDHRWHLRDLV